MDLEYMHLSNVKLKIRYMHFHYFTLHRGLVLVKSQGTIILCTSHSLISQSDGRDGVFWPTIHKCVTLLREVLVFYEIFVDSTQQKRQFLGALARLRKAAIGFFMSVRLSVNPRGTAQLSLDEFSWTFYWKFLENMSLKFQFH